MTSTHAEEITEITHHIFVIPGVVDGDVAKKQAFQRLTDLRTKGERTLVHAHRKANKCSSDCQIFHNCSTDERPRGHSLSEACPVEEEEESA